MSKEYVRSFQESNKRGGLCTGISFNDTDAFGGNMIA